MPGLLFLTFNSITFEQNYGKTMLELEFNVVFNPCKTTVLSTVLSTVLLGAKCPYMYMDVHCSQSNLAR